MSWISVVFSAFSPAARSLDLLSLSCRRGPYRRGIRSIRLRLHCDSYIVFVLFTALRDI